MRTWWGSWSKSQKKCGPPTRLHHPGVSLSHPSPHLASSNSSKLPFKCFYQFVALAISATGKQILAVTQDSPISPDFRVVVSPEA